MFCPVLMVYYASVTDAWRMATPLHKHRVACFLALYTPSLEANYKI